MIVHFPQAYFVVSDNNNNNITIIVRLHKLNEKFAFCQLSDDKQSFESINKMISELVSQRRLIMSRKLTVVRIFNLRIYLLTDCACLSAVVSDDMS